MGKKIDNQGLGILAALGAYIIWGFLPLYWKLLNHVSAGEVLAHRVIWSLVLMIIILLILGKFRSFIKEVKVIFSTKKQLLLMFLAALFISLNWFTFIWAVSNEMLVETSLGYYINPLISVVIGLFIFKEQLTRYQIISFILAAIGVLILVIYTGGIPLISLILAFSFAFYGVIKKISNVSALTGLAVETLMVTPFALLYLTFIHTSIRDAFYLQSEATLGLLIGAGTATAVPLLLFAIGARRIPLSMIGFLQYLAPTIMLFIGVFLFGEAFSKSHLIAFSFIWAGLAIYTFSKSKLLKRTQHLGLEKLKRPAS